MDPARIGQVLVPHPSPEAAIDDALFGLGWHPAGHTRLTRSWARPGGFPAVVAHADPVTGLRWVDCRDVPPHGRAALLSALPSIQPADVLEWLSSPSSETQLRGIQTAHRMNFKEMRPRLQALSESEGIVADAAFEVLEFWASDAEGQQRAMLALSALILESRPVIAELAEGDFERFVPDEAAARAVFAPAVAAAAAEAYDAFWEQQPDEPLEVAGDLEVHAATGAMFRDDGPWMKSVAQGFRGIAGALRPEVTWLSWRWSDVGARWDGLVFVEGQWRWFPKPYRVLRTVLQRMWDGVAH